MTKTMAGLIGRTILALALQLAFADAYVGQFVGQLDDEEYRLAGEPDVGNQYKGELHVAGTRLVLSAWRLGESVLEFRM